MKSPKLQSKTQNWGIKKLGKVAEVFNGKTAPKDLYTDDGVPIVKVKNVTGNGLRFDDLEYIPEDFYSKNNKAAIIAGDVLMVNAAHKADYIGRCDLIERFPESAKHNRWMAVGELMIIRADRGKMHPLILESIFKRPSFRKRIVSLANPSTPHLYPKDMKNLKVPIPPLEIQRQIVERLDAIRKAQQLNDKQIALAEELFQSLLHQELDPTRSTSSGQEGKNWEVKRLGEVSDFAKGATKKFLEGNSEALMLRIMDFDWGSFTKSPGIKISFDPAKKQFILSEDEILFDPVNGSEEQIGKSVFIGGLSPFNEIMVAESNLIRIRADKDLIRPQFLSAFLVSRYGKIGLKKITSKTSAGQYLIKSTLLRNLKIPIPSLSTQHRIVQKLQAVQDYKKSLLAQKEKLQELFESTLDKSMKGEL